MRQISRPRYALAVVLASWVLAIAPGAGAGAGTTYDPGLGFSFQIPDGWVEVPQDQLQAMSRKVFSEKPGNLTIVSAFQAKDVPWFSYPYVMVQTVRYPTSRPPNESEMREVVRAFKQGNIKQSAAGMSPQMRELAKSASIAEVDFDAEARKFTVPLELRVAGAGTVQGKVVGHFGRTQLVQLCCYDVADTFGTSQLKFNTILNSFKFEKHWDIPETAVGDSKKIIIGLAIGGAVVLVMMFVGGKKKGMVPPPPPPPPPPPVPWQ